MVPPETDPSLHTKVSTGHGSVPKGKEGQGLAYVR